MNLKLLRDATRPEHEATEAVVPLMHLQLTRAEYVTVLQRFYDVIRAWESVADSEAPPVYAELLQQRRRGDSLEADLRFFDASVPGESPKMLRQQMRTLIGDAATDSAERSSRFLGLMYVVEGSTLGGQYIAEHLKTVLHLEPGRGDRFFRGYGADTIPKWREFQQALLQIPDAEGDCTIQAAKGMFRIFGEWLSRAPESTLEACREERHDVSGGTERLSGITL